MPEPARERFFSPGRTIGVLIFILFSLTFVRAQVDDDGLYYYAFLRRLFGVHTPAFAYQFGSVFWNAPFWLVSQLVAVRAQFDHYHAGEIGITVASNCAVLLTVYLAWRILRELDLPRGPAVLMLTVFGTPLWFYVVSSPSYKHAADALYCTAAFWFLLRASQYPRDRYLIGAGLCLALLLATRYVNIALLAGVVVMFARRRKELLWVLGSTLFGAAALYALPVIRSISYHRSSDLPFNTVGMDGPPLAINSPESRLALGNGPFGLIEQHAHLDILAPYKMLFTLHRGLFIWTPLTAFATLGFVLLVVRDRRNRPFLLGLAASAFALLELHVLYGNGLWDGGIAYSERFLTALFPFYVLGVAEIVRRWRWPMTALLTICVVWSLFLGLVVLIGYRGTGGSVVEITEYYLGPYHYPPPHNDLGWFVDRLGMRFTDRWGYLWRLM